MFKRNLWKILISVAIAGWALSELIPIHDIPFGTYAKAHASAKPEEFAKVYDEAVARNAANPAISVYTALKQIGTERKLDLTQYFPDIRLESTLRNIDKRNDILLKELLLRSKAKLQRGLDLAGGVSVTLQVDANAGAKDTTSVQKDKLGKAIEIIKARVNQFGLGETIVRAVGDDRIEVELPGVSTKNNPEIVDSVKAPAKLEFRMVHPTLSPETSPPGEIPPGYQLMTLDDDRGTQDVTRELFIKRIPEATGEIISKAFAHPDPYGKPEIAMQFTSEGGKAFAELTKKISDEGKRSGHLGRLAIVLDGKLYEAPTVHDEIAGGQGVIEGSFSDREAMRIADVLNNPLDLPLKVIEQYEVGPSLAADAVSSGVTASIIGTAAVAAFMIIFYSTGGIVAVLTLAVNITIILGTMASLGATMTLPGLAGIVLTIGMAVDANILIFERMREELAVGKSLATANQSGYIKALTTIIDAHFVQLIICAIMIWLGTGPIKGFGYTLMIGVLSTMFTVLITAHLIMEEIIGAGWVKKITMRHLLKSIHMDFVRYGKPAAIISVALVVVGVADVIYQGNHIYGIDFAGGDVVKMQFQQKPDADTAKVTQAAAAAKIGEVSATYLSAVGGGRELLQVETPENQAPVLFGALQKAFPTAGLQQVGLEHIGGSVGKEIELNALLAVGVSMLTILMYIAFRFEFGFGVGAMCSTLHDILMTIGIFVLTGHQFSAPMVAAILCIAGYSINETVVVFDRIREELKLNPTGSLRDVINSAINKVFARTIMTATTTFLAALSLYIFGSGVLRDISFTFLVGIITSTFSAIFIAAQVFYWWHKGDRKHVEAHADVAPKYDWAGSSKASR